jgi:glycosyltransferase involved in cell wall biosynthesis
MGRFAIKHGKKYKIPVVSTLHTQYHQDFARVAKGNKLFVKIALKYIVHVYNHSDSVWTVSQKSAEFLRMYGYKGKVTVIRNGTDYVYPTNADELVKRVNELHGLDGQKNVFLFVGRMAWYKNLKLICDSMKVLKDKGEDFKMIFVGSGFDIEEVKDYIDTIGIADKCILTGQINDRELLQGYYLRSDLMVFPSTFDMASIVKEEAAAHKLACILVKGSCCAERVVDNENGFLCEENVESLSSRLLELVKNPEKMKQVGENALKMLYRNWDDVSQDVYDEYVRIIKKYKEELTEKELIQFNKIKERERKKAERIQKRLRKKRLPLSE